MTSFASWLDRFLSEKGIDSEEVLECCAFDGTPNLIPVEVLVTSMKQAPEKEQRSMKSLLVKVDFRAGDVRKVLAYLAQAIALPRRV